jgi:hypothetical protein
MGLNVGKVELFRSGLGNQWPDSSNREGHRDYLGFYVFNMRLKVKFFVYPET